MLIVKPISSPVESRMEVHYWFRVRLNLFHNREKHAFHDWLRDQTFNVVKYEGWYPDFFFEDINGFILTKLMFSDFEYEIPYYQPEAFDSYMEPLRRKAKPADQFDECMVKLKAERARVLKEFQERRDRVNTFNQRPR